MPSPTKTFRMSPDLAAICDTRARQLGYSNASDYLRGLARYDAMVNGTHDLTLSLSKLPLDEQDKIDARLAENVKAGICERGQFLAHFIKNLQK